MKKAPVKVSQGVAELFDEPSAESAAPKQVNVISKGTLPFPKESAAPTPAKPAKVEQPKVFPTKRNTGETISLDGAKALIARALFQRMQEVSKIGWDTQHAYDNADDKDAIPVEFQILKERAFKELVYGSTRSGKVIILKYDKYPDTAGQQISNIGQLQHMVMSCKNVAPIKRMSNGRKLYMFELSDVHHQAFTDTVRIEDMLALDYQRLIRMEREQILDKDGKVTGYRQLLYTPNGACPLLETKIVSFIYHDDTGLELWQPGQYIGALNPKEKEAWVHLNLLEH